MASAYRDFPAPQNVFMLKTHKKIAANSRLLLGKPHYYGTIGLLK